MFAGESLRRGCQGSYTAAASPRYGQSRVYRSLMWLCPSCGAMYDDETWTSREWQEGYDQDYETGLEEDTSPTEVLRGRRRSPGG